MKIRNGFVSNSSSSSFLIYGISDYTIPEDGDNVYELADKAGLEAHRPEGSDWYIGKCLTKCKDDQTMGDFKKEIRELVNKTFGEHPDKEFGFHEECWY